MDDHVTPTADLADARAYALALQHEVVTAYLAAVDAHLDGEIRGGQTGEPTGMLPAAKRCPDLVRDIREAMDRVLAAPYRPLDPPAVAPCPGHRDGARVIGAIHDEIHRLTVERPRIRYAPGVAPRPAPRPLDEQFSRVRAALDRYRSMTPVDSTEARMSPATRDSIRDRLREAGLLDHPAPDAAETIYGLPIVEDPALPFDVIHIGPRGRIADHLPPHPLPALPRASVHIEPACPILRG